MSTSDLDDHQPEPAALGSLQTAAKKPLAPAAERALAEAAARRVTYDRAAAAPPQKSAVASDLIPCGTAIGSAMASPRISEAIRFHCG